MKLKYKVISAIFTLLYLGAGCTVYILTDRFYITAFGMGIFIFGVHYLLWSKLARPSRAVIVFLDKSVQGTVSEVYILLWIKPFYKVKVDGGEEVITNKICSL